MKHRLIAAGIAMLGLGAFALPKAVVAWTYTPASHEDIIRQPHLTADGSALVVTTDIKNKTFDQLYYFSTKSNTPNIKFSPDQMLNTVAISGDGKTIVAAGSKIWLFKRPNRNPVWTLKVGVSVFGAVAVTPTGNAIFAGDNLSAVHLFKPDKAKEVKSWPLGSEDGIQSLAISTDGRTVLAGTHLSVNLIKTDKAAAAWKYKTAKHIEQVALSADGKYAAATTADTLYFFNTSSRTPAWSKKISSYYALNVQMSDDGSVIIVGSTKATYAFNRDGTERWHWALPSGLKGEIAVSNNGKYVAASQGSNYVYLFDNAFGAGNRPFRIYSGETPRYVALDKTGDMFAYGKNGLTTLTPPPGILADQLSTPIYSSGSNLKLRLFATNPGAANDNLKVRVALSLPQINWWNSMSGQKDTKNQPPATRSKTLNYIASALPGYSVVYDQPYSPGKNASLDTTVDISVPSLLMPQWLSDALAAVNNVLPIGTLLSDMTEPLTNLLGKDPASDMTSKANADFAAKNTIFPTLGIGTIQLYDSRTGVVYDVDSFYFIFGLSG